MIKINCLNRQRGFTLLEVLVASIILITSLSVISLIYRGAYISADKANVHAQISGVIPSIISNIQKDIRQSDNADNFKITKSDFALAVHYQYIANVEKYSAPPPYFNIDQGQFVTPKEKYKLWRVELKLQLNNVEKIYTFYELSWVNEKS